MFGADIYLSLPLCLLFKLETKPNTTCVAADDTVIQTLVPKRYLGQDCEWGVDVSRSVHKKHFKVTWYLRASTEPAEESEESAQTHS